MRWVIEVDSIENQVAYVSDRLAVLQREPLTEWVFVLAGEKAEPVAARHLRRLVRQ